jgi:hypothetical protein
MQRVPVGGSVTDSPQGSTAERSDYFRLLTDPAMPGPVPIPHGVQVRLQGLSGNCLSMNLGWYRIHPVP